MITTCSLCGDLYESGSGEQADEPGRLCRNCLQLSDEGRAAVIKMRKARRAGNSDRKRLDGR